MKPVWSSSFGRPRPTITLMMFVTIPDRATEVKTKKQRRCQPVGHGGKAVSGKDVPPGKKKKQADSTGWDKRPFAVADFRHRAEEH